MSTVYVKTIGSGLNAIVYVMTTLGDRILEVRNELGISHREVTDRMAKYGVKVHFTVIHKLESRSSTKSKYSSAIARALGVNHEWLTEGKGPREALRSLDRKLQLLPADEIDDVYDDLSAIIDRRLEKGKVRQ